MRLLIMGPPGAGKGTQGERLAEALGVPRFSTGDFLRDARQADTELGRRARGYMDAGELVPLHNTALVTEDYYWMALNEATENREATDVFWQWISENLRHYADHMDQEYSSVA